MLGLFNDVLIALKIVGFLILLRWVMENIQNRFLATLLLLVAAYYLLFVEWDIYGLFVIFFILISATGITYFVQDLVFQYGSVREHEEVNPTMLMFLRRR